MLGFPVDQPWVAYSVGGNLPYRGQLKTLTLKVPTCI
jgi:hypothetical protein